VKDAILSREFHKGVLAARLTHGLPHALCGMHGSSCMEKTSLKYFTITVIKLGGSVDVVNRALASILKTNSDDTTDPMCVMVRKTTRTNKTDQVCNRFIASCNW